MARPVLLGESLQLCFPEAEAIAVTAAAVGCDREGGGVGVALLAEVFPPAQDRVDRELGGVVVDPDVDPAPVVGEVVDPVGDRLPELLVFEVVAAYQLGFTLRAPLPSRVLEVADELFLLGIHTDHRLPGNKRRLHSLVDVLELLVAVGMLGALPGLAVGLQAVAQLLQRLQNGAVGDLVACLTQPDRELRSAPRAPPQRPPVPAELSA